MKNLKIGWLEGAVIVLLLFLAFRFFFFARMAILFGLVALVVGIFGYVLYQRMYKTIEVSPSQQKSLNAIWSRIMYCEEQLERLKEEIKDIRKDLIQLKKSTERQEDLTATNREETKRLIVAFENELRIREKKKQFFDTCLRKLKKLLRNQELAIDLAEKEGRLRQLQEGHYEDLAEMEALRSDLELDVFYLDTIESLSERMLLTTSTDEAEALQIELEKMTRELDEL